MVIAIDFDGTCVTHEFPGIGFEIGATPILRALDIAGHQLILNTMRSNTKQGSYLKDAEDWFKERNIKLYSSGINPTQRKWTSSKKCHADLYIDDRALGVPLINGIHPRPYVDWYSVRKYLVEKGIL